MSVRHSSTHKYTEIQSLVVGDEKLGVEDAHSSVAVCDCPAGCAFLTAVYLMWCTAPHRHCTQHVKHLQARSLDLQN